MLKQAETKKLTKRLRELFNAAFSAKIHYEIWILTDAQKNRKDVLECYGDFFEPTALAHFTAMLMAVCKIYNSGNNIYTLIKDCPPTQTKSLKNILDKEGQRIKKIINLRNKFFGHCVLDGESAFKKFRVEPEDFRCLIESTINLLNQISALHNQGSFEIEQDSAETTNRLLDVLSKNAVSNLGNTALK